MANSRKGARTTNVADRAEVESDAVRSDAGGGAAKEEPARPRPPWMTFEEPATRSLKVYALDPSAGNYVGNVMSIQVRWERNLKPGPIGRRFAVIDYDASNDRYYPPVDLNDYRILAQGGLDPSESDPRFHQQMVYAVASETLERFESALGRSIHWRRATRPAGEWTEAQREQMREQDIWVLKLYPHAMVQANAFYSRDAQGILFGYFRAEERNQGNNLPGQRVFTCLSHDIIAHEVTHAIIDGIRMFFTEPTNPDVLAFHEAFADLTALFLHFSHKEALLDTIRKTGGQLYQFELRPDVAPATGSASVSERNTRRNPLVELARQFGEASGRGRALRQALDEKPDPTALARNTRDPHSRGAILVAAVFDAFFSTYLRASAPLFRIYRAGGGAIESAELPTSLAQLLTESAASTADRFFQLCARALDYCPPVDVTFGDFLRALITVSVDLDPEDPNGIRQALMQAFRVRGIYPDGASFFSEDALCWTALPEWSPDEAPLPAVQRKVTNPQTGKVETQDLVFGHPLGLTKEQMDTNGDILRAYARANAKRLGFDDNPALRDDEQPFVPSFHQVFRTGADGRTRVDMVVEIVQTRRVPFDPATPEGGTFPARGGVTLIVSGPSRDDWGKLVSPRVRFAIGKRLVGSEGEARANTQRLHFLEMGLANGATHDDRHFQADFGLVHEGL